MKGDYTGKAPLVVASAVRDDPHMKGDYTKRVIKA